MRPIYLLLITLLLSAAVSAGEKKEPKERPKLINRPVVVQPGEVLIPVRDATVGERGQSGQTPPAQPPVR